MAKSFKENAFWQAKFQRAMEVRDVDKDGFIQIADFKLIVQRYREMGAPDDHLKKIEQSFERTFAKVGLIDDTTALTYQEFSSNFAKILDKLGNLGSDSSLFKESFNIIDTNEDGKISFSEWVNFYKALGIDPIHAKASFDAMDSNGDGVVSMEEFIAYNEEFFFSTEDTLKSSILFGPIEYWDSGLVSYVATWEQSLFFSIFLFEYFDFYVAKHK